MKTIKTAEKLQLDAEISVYTLINNLIWCFTDQYLTNNDVGFIASVSDKTKEKQVLKSLILFNR
ncbi:hypothetical protein [Alkalibacterium sp. 20]|uniref:hypothetical protein n=1 Tax=Alkalibacterium sp. 20 TaxID=1798803 RepID=UPI0008FFF00E|nr:hypothetical protein [Alkalibacterium sp. 20]OJF91406.1 hypothetical protein AX762_11060 [Alkalibacterium sp. 20]